MDVDECRVPKARGGIQKQKGALVTSRTDIYVDRRLEDRPIVISTLS